MEIKYAVRTISPSPQNGPCYLQESEYGLQFTFRASEPRGTPGQREVRVSRSDRARDYGSTDIRKYGIKDLRSDGIKEMNVGGLKEPRLGMFKKLLELIEKYKRVNQWG